MTKKKVIIAVCLAAVVGGSTYAVYRSMQTTEETVSKETSVEFGNLTVGITESGTASLGTVEQTFDIELGTDSSASSPTSGATTSAGSGNMETAGEMMGVSTNTSNAGNAGSSASGSEEESLQVEEIYVTEGQVVEEGEPLLKLSSESIKKVREQLQKEIDSASLTLENSKIERKSAKIEAEYTYKENIAAGKNAKTIYQSSLISLADAVEEAQDAVEEADDRMNEIQEEITSLKAKKKKISASGSNTASQANGGMDTSGMPAGMDSTGGEKITTSDTSKNTTTSNDTSTVSGINAEIQSLQKEYQSLKQSYSSLVSKVSQAKSEQVEGKISAKQAYDEAMLNYENAQEIYDIALDGIDDDVEDAKDAWKDAKDNLKEFEDFVQDGEVLAEYNGTILSVGYEDGDYLESGTAIATFADADAVSITISVSQEDVSNVAVDDEVNIAFSAYEEETYQGNVTEIATSETSSSSSATAYDVTVKVQGDVSKIYEGMTANVTFITKELKDVLYVSNKAIRTEGTKSYVKKVEGDTTTNVEVTTGFSNGESVEIQDGLEEGDVVLIESQVSGS